MVTRWDNSPPYTGFTHTVLPLFERGLIVVTDECTSPTSADWPKLIWILDARAEGNPIPISTCPIPDADAFTSRGRFGAHNIFENTPVPTAWHSEDIIIGTFFNGGLRAFDISNPYQPKEVGLFVPATPPLSASGTIQLNDVFVDERAIVYTVDRQSGGLYTLEIDF
jgi:hypothetical protein